MIEDTNNAAAWFYRVGGVVGSAAWAVEDPTPLLRGNAYAKTWRGEALSDAEAAALQATNPAQPLADVGGDMGGDLVLGAISIHRPDLLQAVDRIAAELETMGLLGGPVFAWSILRDYTASALAVTMDRAGMGSETAALERLERAGIEPDERAAIKHKWAEERAAGEAWSRSEEGRAAAAAMVADGGPEGWSQVPPANEDHPCHPARRA